MGFIDTLKERAKANVKTIVLPETEDKRTLAATEKILKEGIAKVILVGNEEAVKKSAAEDGYDISGAQIVDPATSEKTQGYIDKLVELRQKKGMTPDQAKEILLNQYLYYGVMMVKMGDADGMVSGACHSTADTLRPCLQILKTKPGTKLVSAFFLMVVPNCEYGANGAFVFADSGLNQNPTSEELAAIAASSAESFELLVVHFFYEISIFIRMAVEPFLYQSFEIVIFLLSHTSISLIVLQGLSSFLRQYPCIV